MANIYLLYDQFSMKDIPLSLYIHIPWCIKKCPYCDFNSHTQQGNIPEKAYINQLINELTVKKSALQGRKISTIFIGGGTPSLFHPDSLDELLFRINDIAPLERNCEITLEANPGTIVPNRFEGYKKAGINRVSIGVQSFQTEKLKALGRIHQGEQAQSAITAAKVAGFEEINIDLMFGLPNQTVEEALFDLEQAIAHDTSHLSWYQLTLEPNTLFYRYPPVLPDDDRRFDMQQAGQQFLANNGLKQYEISAYSKPNHACQHNLNYWQFGDYIGIGAGAHGKVTDLATGEIVRTNTIRNPKQYLNRQPQDAFLMKTVDKEEIPLEFMMNALRLNAAIPLSLFESRTGIGINLISQQIEKAENNNLLEYDHAKKELRVTAHGRLFLNDLLALF